jgi:hypothetical protein
MLTRQTPWRVSLPAIVAMLVGMAGVLSAPSPAAVAQSDQECWTWRRVITGEDENGDPLYGYRIVNICEDDGSSEDSGEATCGDNPCFHPTHGWWSEAYDCYIRLADPQPPVGDPAWADNSPEDGAIYTLACPQGDGTYRTPNIFLEQAPEVPSVTVLVQQAVEQLPLVSADIGIAPRPGGAGLVGLPVWMWTNNADATWGPVEVRVPGPGITVVAQAEATRIEWDMGDGHTVVCDEPGTPYHPRYGGEPSPDCPYVYSEPSRDQPDGRYTVTATTTWYIEWWVEPSGPSGDDAAERTSSTTVRINELQVVTS